MGPMSLLGWPGFRGFRKGNDLLHEYKVKVKCTLVQALRLCTGRTAHRESRGIALPFHDHGTRWGWGVSVTPRPLFTPGKDQVPIVQEAGWAPGPDWTGAENLALTGIRSPDRPSRSQSPYRLSYPAQFMNIQRAKIYFQWCDILQMRLKKGSVLHLTITNNMDNQGNVSCLCNTAVRSDPTLLVSYACSI